MNLRSKGSCRYQITRRRLRLGLAIALASTSLSTVCAQARQTQLSTSPSAECTEELLLPYPFAGGAFTAPRTSTISQRVVRLFGLSHSLDSQASFSVVLASGEEPLNACSKVGENCEQTSSNVVPAAVGANHCADSNNAATDSACSDMVPSSQTEAPQLNRADGTENSIAEQQFDSLIDIDIPLKFSEVTPEPERPSLTAPAIVEQTPRSNTAQLPSEPPATPARKPQLVHQSKSMSLTVTPPAARSQRDKLVVAGTQTSNTDKLPTRSSADATEPSLNFSDKLPADRGVQLHLSSALPIRLQDSSERKMASSAMQVRIEGEPAPFVADFKGVAVSSTDGKSSMPMFSPAREAARAKSLPSLLVSQKNLVPASKQEEPSQPAPELHVREPITVNSEDSRALTADASVVEVSVEHPDVCQLLKTGDKSVSLIGMRPGSTRIAIVTSKPDGKRVVEVGEVTVRDGTQTEISLPRLASEMSQTVSRMFPNSELQIVAYKAHLVVRGFAADEDDAKKILTVVRKTSLVPVVDQLQTYGK